MQGVGSFDGDLLIVDRHIQVKHLDVIVANFNGESVQPVVTNEFDNFTQEGVVIRSIRCRWPSNLLGGD
ncbi:hypothetical protein BCU23_22170 [Vibrio splendidus]|nr:hypothetical protein OC1_07500 [Vibrio cyclitrophicus ZF207]OEF69252.1 hypothetical protein A148_23465 [Vibrio splendidus 1F-157]PMJ55259.1 hypothetical protein BCU23_22170 [Vibrio splendidus]PMK21908.1 hypothetical protein BCU04_19400 [Vibrio cyclitrophicus]PMK07628.1 hypothetical protein BCU10_03380 [Vibrio splendidus]